MSSLLFGFLSILGVIALASGQEQLLMVFGGLPWRGPALKNVTLLSLDGGPPVPECLQNLNRHPRGLRESCPAALGDGKLQMNLEKTLILIARLSVLFYQTGKIPHVCGGDYSGCDEDDFVCEDNGSNDECYRYNPGKGTAVVPTLQNY